MGYCYDKNGNLICDFCGSSKSVKKVRCPFGYCPPDAVCPDCKSKHENLFSKEYHRNKGCERLSKAHDEREAQRNAILESGGVVRCSAMGTDDGAVHVLFSDKNYDCVGFFMSSATYNSIELLVVATPDDFRKYGELIPAPSSFWE